MELKKNQFVVFADGHKEGYLEARWSERNKAFYSFDENGEKIFSTTIIEKSAHKTGFKPSAKNCTVEIHPYGETEKAYAIHDGGNGKVGRGFKSYTKHIAKSICYVDESGNIFAPAWAM